MQTIPISDLPNQTVNALLGGQSASLTIYQTAYGLFINLSVNDALVIGGVICENLNRVVRDAYLGFVGDLVFNDTQGSDDPVYPGLGTRFQLVYLTDDEADAAEALQVPA